MATVQLCENVLTSVFTSVLRLNLLWFVGAFVVLAIGLWSWFDVAPESRLLDPKSPVDATHIWYAQQWRFLDAARRFVPPGSTVTFVSSHPDTDMQLFMIALGVMPDCTPLPWTYWLAPQPAHSSQARYVLTYLRDPPPEEKVVEIGRIEGAGLIVERQK